MADILTEYGTDYKQDVLQDKRKNALDVIANNLANCELTFVYNSTSLWNNYNMYRGAIKAVLKRANALSPDTHIGHIDKRGSEVKQLPYLLNGTVEYWYVLNIPRKTIYYCYSTPTQFESY